MLAGKWILGPGLAVMAFVIDRLTKVYFVEHSDSELAIIQAWIWLRLHLNTGMAFSLPLFPIVYYSAVSVVIVGLLFRLAQIVQQHRLAEYAIIIFILIGAISNIIDRIYYGGVVDFIATRLGNVFNLADVYIVSAVLVWCSRVVWYEHKHKTIPKKS